MIELPTDMASGSTTVTPAAGAGPSAAMTGVGATPATTPPAGPIAGMVGSEMAGTMDPTDDGAEMIGQAGGETPGPAATPGMTPTDPAAPMMSTPTATADEEAALEGLEQLFPPLSTPEMRVPSPDNPAECPAEAPENPVGDCLGLPIYVNCVYGTYNCVCDWYHWLCFG